MNLQVFEKEFTRQITPNIYYLYRDGYREVCRYLDLPSYFSKAFGIYKKGITEGYTPKDGIKIQKDALEKKDNSELKEIVKNYISNYRNNILTSETFKGFIILSLIGDMPSHPLFKEFSEVYKKTEDIFSKIKPIAHENCFLTSEGDKDLEKLGPWLEENNIILPDWTTLRSRYIPVLWPLNIYWTWNMEETVGIQEPIHIVQVTRKGNLTGYHSKRSIKAIGEAVLPQLKEKNMCDLRQDALKAGRELVNYSKQFASEEHNSIEPFIEYFKRIEELCHKLMKENAIWWSFTNEVLEKETKNLPEEVKLAFDPLEKSYSQIEEEEFEEVSKIAEKHGLGSQEAKLAIKRFSEDYIWFPYEYNGPVVWDEKTVTKRIQDEIGKSQDKNDKIKPAQIDIPKENRTIVEIIRTLTLMRDDRKMFNSQVCYYTNKIILSKLAKLLNLPIEKVNYFDVKLLEDVLEGKDIEPELDKRSKIVLTYRDSKGQVTYSGAAAEEFLDRIGIYEEKEDAKEVRGMIANKGFATGNVRILRHSGEEFLKGEILVTGMTTPDFLPLMKKAAAIVTDEGGITSHAAIVARELGKPCIIGTKHATEVLKDGDKVEVDANTGVVRKIS